MIHYITGGERFGKSSYARKLAAYRIWDKEFKKRVERHKNDRDERWTTIEEEKEMSKVIPKNSVVAIDCVTLLLANLYFYAENNVEKASELATIEIENQPLQKK